MRTTKVEVVPFDENWKADFEAIRGELLSAVGEWIVGIEHVGSTSVEGMSAKPCIDIDIVIEDYSVFEIVRQKLGDIGYHHEGDLGIRHREAFGYSDKPHLKKHHLYVCPRHSEELHRHIAFREFLKTHPSAVREYSTIKERGAQLYPWDIGEYMRYKSPCIEKIYAQIFTNELNGAETRR